MYIGSDEASLDLGKRYFKAGSLARPNLNVNQLTWHLGNIEIYFVARRISNEIYGILICYTSRNSL